MTKKEFYDSESIELTYIRNWRQRVYSDHRTKSEVYALNDVLRKDEFTLKELRDAFKKDKDVVQNIIKELKEYL